MIRRARRLAEPPPDRIRDDVTICVWALLAIIAVAFLASTVPPA